MADNKEIAALFAMKNSGDVTPASIVSATGRMSAAQAAQTLANLGGAAVYPVAITYGVGGWTADKTLAQCLAAMSAGNVVLLALNANGNIYEVVAARAEGGISGTFAITLADGMLYLAEIWFRTENGVDTVDFTGYTVAKDSGSDFVVALSQSVEADGWVADKTFAETIAAFKGGRSVAFLVTIGTMLYHFSDICVETIANEDALVARKDGVDPHPQKLFIIWAEDLLYVTGRYYSPWGVQDKSLTSASVPGSVREETVDFIYGELSSLTITTFPTTGVWRIEFASGDTPTALTLPQGLLGLEDFTPEADTEYVLELAFGVGYVGSPESNEEEEEEE